MFGAAKNRAGSGICHHRRLGRIFCETKDWYFAATEKDALQKILTESSERLVSSYESHTKLTATALPLPANADDAPGEL